MYGTQFINTEKCFLKIKKTQSIKNLIIDLTKSFLLAEYGQYKTFYTVNDLVFQPLVFSNFETKMVRYLRTDRGNSDWNFFKIASKHLMLCICLVTLSLINKLILFHFFLKLNYM